MMVLTIVILALITIERAAELPFAELNTRRLKAMGAHEVAPGHYPVIVVIHALWLAALWWFAPGQQVDMALLTLFGLVEIGRAWVLWTLGRRWTTRIIVLPGETLVRRGPYRFTDHPNYWIVVAEVFLLPAVFGLWWIAILFSILNGAWLIVRIRAENRALGRTE